MSTTAAPKKIGVTFPAFAHQWGEHRINPLGFWQRDCTKCGVSQYRSRRQRAWSQPQSAACDGWGRL